MTGPAGRTPMREPFSSSPDPNFLLETRQHGSCLQELEISLRLRRGLCVVTGDIGTGKTTLCRCLLRSLAADPKVDAHLLLDPRFDDATDFLRVIFADIAGRPADPQLSPWRIKEELKRELFRLGVVENRLEILIIDEGQKISRENLENLRELLNYETNTAKLLQIVIFAQRELEPVIDSMPNLADRITLRRRLRPMTLAETRRMIRHRLAVAAGEGEPNFGFTWPAILAVYLAGGGSPRRSVRLCHHAMLEMLVRGRNRIGLFETLAAARAETRGKTARRRGRRLALAAALAALLVLGGFRLFGPANSGRYAGRAALRPIAAGNALAAPAAGLPPLAARLSPEPEAERNALRGGAARVSLRSPQDAGSSLRAPVARALPPGPNAGTRG